MNNDLLNILSNSNKDIDNQQLMDYLSGKLSGQDRHDLERLMADNDFMNDAVEGLEDVGDKKNIELYVEQLNRSLKKSLEKKKGRRQKRRFRENPWGYAAVIVIILVCIAGYFVIRKILAHG